jgi:hypothetical protein
LWQACTYKNGIVSNASADFVNVERLAEPKMSDTVIDKIVTDSGTKDLIKAVAHTYNDRN